MKEQNPELSFKNILCQQHWHKGLDICSSVLCYSYTVKKTFSPWSAYVIAILYLIPIYAILALSYYLFNYTKQFYWTSIVETQESVNNMQKLTI